MATYSGQLNQNEIISTLFNSIISWQVTPNNLDIGYNSLEGRFEVEGSQYGDTKLYTSTDIGDVYSYEADTDDQVNVLKLYRPKDPYTQAIELKDFYYYPLTIDSYLSKRIGENLYGDVNASFVQWMSTAKDVEKVTRFNAFVGTEKSDHADVEVDFSGIITPVSTVDDESANRQRAQAIAATLSALETDISDIGTTYNDIGFTRAYAPENLIVVWNAAWYNYLKKYALSSSLLKDGLLELKRENVLPARYFGTVNASSTTATAGTRALKHLVIEETSGGVTTVHRYRAGDQIKVGLTVPAGASYQETSAPGTDGSIICKVIHKDSAPYMAAFETTSEFFNAKNLSTNKYLHFGLSDLKHREDLPWLTVIAAEPEPPEPDPGNGGDGIL